MVLLKNYARLSIPLRIAIPGILIVAAFSLFPLHDTLAIFHGSIAGAFRLLLLGLPLLIVALVSFVLNFLTAIVLAMGGLALQFSMVITGTMKLTSGGIVDLGWAITRDLVNLFFILILVAIALATILGVEQYAVKKTLPKLLVALLFINFSKVIIGVGIDIAHIIARVFLDPVSSSNLAAQFLTSTGAFVEFFKQIWEASTTGLTEMFSITLQFMIQMLLGAVFNIFLAFVLLTMAMVFIARIVIIWILVIVSPLAIAASVLPATASHFTKWKKDLIQWVFLIIPVSFFIYLGFAFLQSGVPLFTDTLQQLGPELKDTLNLPGPFEDFVTVIFALFKQLLTVITLAMIMFAGLSVGFSTSQSMAQIGGKNIGKWAADRVKGLRDTRLGRRMEEAGRKGVAGTLRAATRVSPLQLAAETGRLMQKRGGAPGRFVGGGIEKATESEFAKRAGRLAGKPLRPFGTALRTGAERLELGTEELKKKERERKTKRIDLLAGQLLAKKRDIEKLGLSREEEQKRIDAVAAAFTLDGKNAVLPGEKIARAAALNKANLTHNAERGVATMTNPGKTQEQIKEEILPGFDLTKEMGTSDAQVAQELKELDRKLWDGFLIKRIHKLGNLIPQQKGEGDVPYEDRLTREEGRLLRSREFTPEVFAQIPLPIHTNKGFVEKMEQYMTLDKLAELEPLAREKYVQHWNALLSRAQLEDNPELAFKGLRDRNPNFIDSIKNNPTFNSGIKIPDSIAGLNVQQYNAVRNSATDDWVGEFLRDLKATKSHNEIGEIKNAMEDLLKNQGGDISRLVKSQATALTDIVKRQIESQVARNEIDQEVGKKLTKNAELTTEQWRALLKTLQRIGFDFDRAITLGQGKEPGQGAATTRPTPTPSTPSAPPRSPLATPGTPDYQTEEEKIRKRTSR